MIAGRGAYDAAGAWGGSNPWDAPFFVVTHRVEDQPEPGAGFDVVPDLVTALAVRSSPLATHVRYAVKPR